MDSRGHRERFPGLALAWESLRAPPGTTAVLNAANECAWRLSGARASASTRSIR
jgi:1-deoxy-D-xylulose 5-phosphate reductoisomerase